MQSIRFNTTRVEIEGKVYTVMVDSTESYRMAEKSRESIMNSFNKLNGKNPEDIKVEDLEDFVEACEKLVDIILGEGNFQEIWTVAGHNIYNIIPLANGLIEAVNESKRGVMSEYTNK